MNAPYHSRDFRPAQTAEYREAPPFLDGYRDVPHETAVARLMQKVIVDKSTSCWLWQGSITPGGYGQIGMGSQKDGTRRLVQAHIVSFEIFRGDVPDGYELDHKCRCRSCINPNHLEPVTHAENVRRGDGGKHQSVKTHCPKGHPYSEENTYVYQGRRFCRECRRIALRRLYWQGKVRK